MCLRVLSLEFLLCVAVVVPCRNHATRLSVSLNKASGQPTFNIILGICSAQLEKTSWREYMLGWSRHYFLLHGQKAILFEEERFVRTFLEVGPGCGIAPQRIDG